MSDNRYTLLGTSIQADVVKAVATALTSKK